MHRKITRILASLLSFTVLISLVSCGNKAPAESEISSSASSEASKETSADSAESSSAEKSSEDAVETSSEESSKEETLESSDSSQESAVSESKPANSSKPSSSASSDSENSSKEDSSKETSSAESSSPSESAPATSSVSASEIYSAIDAAFQDAYGSGPITNAPYDIDETSLSELFHIDPSWVISYRGSMAGMMTNCDELLVVQAKDGQIDAVRQALEQRLSEQKDSFAHYPVMFNDIRLDDAKVITKGNYAALLIVGVITDEIDESGEADFTGDVEKAENAFYASIG